MNSRFQPHGRYSLSRSGLYVRAQVCGNLNGDLVEKMFAEILLLRQKLPPHWGIIITPLGEDTVGTPDAETQAIRGMLAAFELGCSCFAICPVSELQTHRFEEMALHLPFPLRIYGSLKQAESALAQELDKLNTD